MRVILCDIGGCSPRAYQKYLPKRKKFYEEKQTLNCSGSRNENGNLLVGDLIRPKTIRPHPQIFLAKKDRRTSSFQKRYVCILKRTPTKDPSEPMGGLSRVPDRIQEEFARRRSLKRKEGEEIPKEPRVGSFVVRILEARETANQMRDFL